MPGRKKEVVTTSGYLMEVDISDEACGKFGFKHGDRIRVLGTYDAVVEGVAPVSYRDAELSSVNTLWYARTDYCGRVSHCYPLIDGDLVLKK